LRLPAGKRDARQALNLERSQNPLPIVGMETPARLGIDPPQFLVKPLEAMFFQFPPQLFPNRRITGSGRADPSRQNFHVESRPPDDERHLTPVLEGFDHGPGELRIARCIERFIRIGHVQKMVGNQRPFFRGGFGGADLHIAIDLHGIAIDDLGTKAVGNFEGQLGLSHRSGPGQQDDRRERR